MISKVRIVLDTDKGQIESGVVPIDMTQEVADGWYRVAVSLDKFAGPGKTEEAQLQRVGIFGDIDDYLHVGRVQIVSEEQPLKASAGERREVKVKTEVSFAAADQEGGQQARYQWDFDDWDGISEDGLGKNVTWKFMEPGFYTVTLTVSDIGNTKVPQVAHVDVFVKE